MNNSIVAKYIEDNLVMSSWGDYEGVRMPTIAQLGALQALIQVELIKLAREE